jgi:hypothetical protein
VPAPGAPCLGLPHPRGGGLCGVGFTLTAENTRGRPRKIQVCQCRRQGEGSSPFSSVCLALRNWGCATGIILILNMRSSIKGRDGMVGSHQN